MFAGVPLGVVQRRAAGEDHPGDLQQGGGQVDVHGRAGHLTTRLDPRTRDHRRDPHRVFKRQELRSGEAVLALVAIKEALEDPARILLDV